MYFCINNCLEMDYNKKPKTFTEQVELLEERGLIIEDKEKAISRLANISYYRLSAYMIPFKKITTINNKNYYCDEFISNITWRKVYELYVFDRKLRLLVFDAIERLEIAIRAQIIYQLSHKYGSHWQDNKDIFSTTKLKTKDKTINIDIYSELQEHLQEQLKNNKAEVFIKHYYETYDKPKNPPSWMAVETMYFNQLSKICRNLKNKKDTKDIARYFNIKSEEVFCSWLHSINYIRNLCAHHSRLWNRDMDIIPKLYFYKDNNLNWMKDENLNKLNRNKLYYSLCVLNFFLQTANPTSTFNNRLIDLINDYKDVVGLSYMGFPDNWKEESLWKRK